MAQTKADRSAGSEEGSRDEGAQPAEGEVADVRQEGRGHAPGQHRGGRRGSGQDRREGRRQRREERRQGSRDGRQGSRQRQPARAPARRAASHGASRRRSKAPAPGRGRPHDIATVSLIVAIAGRDSGVDRRAAGHRALPRILFPRAFHRSEVMAANVTRAGGAGGRRGRARERMEAAELRQGAVPRQLPARPDPPAAARSTPAAVEKGEALPGDAARVPRASTSTRSQIERDAKIPDAGHRRASRSSARSA